MLKAITSSLLTSNYFLAKHASGWQEEHIFPSAVSITCRQVFYFSMACLLWFYPRITSPDDLFYLFILAGILAYSFLVAFRKAIFSLFKSLNIVNIVQGKLGGPWKTLFGLGVTGLGLLTFGTATAIKIVGYVSH